MARFRIQRKLYGIIGDVGNTALGAAKMGIDTTKSVASAAGNVVGGVTQGVGSTVDTVGQGISEMKGVGGMAGTIGGAIKGAALGSAAIPIPIVGSALGAIGGAIIGGGIGKSATDMAGKAVSADRKSVV